MYICIYGTNLCKFFVTEMNGYAKVKQFKNTTYHNHTHTLRLTLLGSGVNISTVVCTPYVCYCC